MAAKLIWNPDKNSLVLMPRPENQTIWHQYIFYGFQMFTVYIFKLRNTIGSQAACLQTLNHNMHFEREHQKMLFENVLVKLFTT
jgi:hypothetical protein